MTSVSSRELSLQLARDCALEVVHKRSQRLAFHPADDLLAVLSRITMEALDCALNAQPFHSETLEKLAETITILDGSTDLSKFAFSLSMLMMEMNGLIIGSERRETMVEESVKLEPDDSLLSEDSDQANAGFFDSPSSISDVKLEMEEEEPLGLVKDEEARCETWAKQQAGIQMEKRAPLESSPATHFYCGACQTKVDKIEEHEEAHHKEMWMKKARKCTVDECDYRSLNGAALGQHKHLHSGNTTNNEISYIFPIRTNCPYCETFVRTVAQFISHMNLEHRGMLSSQVPIYICNQCDFSCARVYQMIQHWNERLGACSQGLKFDYAAVADVARALRQRRDAAAKKQQQAAAAAAKKQERQAAAAAAQLQRQVAAYENPLLDAAARAAVADVVAGLQLEREQQAKAAADAAISADAATADEPCGSAKRPRMEDLW